MFKNLKNAVMTKKAAAQASIAASLALVNVQANAALDAALTTALDGVATDIGLLMAEIWPLIGLGIGIGVLIRWSKRGGRAV